MENTRVGPFLIFERLGTSRRQKVFRARQIEQNIDVAIKFLGMPDAEIRARAIDKIQSEIERLKELSHPNLVRTLGAGVDGEQVFIATELIKSESLAKLLSRRGKFAADLVVDYGKQTAELLHYLHEQDLIHGKLTPDKILVTRDGLIKVSDMRLNRSKRKKWSSTKRNLDEVAYLAPEQFHEGSKAKSDIYSLGVILFEMLTGKLPYPPETLNKLARRKMNAKPQSVLTLAMDCPVWLDQLITKMISADPRQRPHSAKAVILAFEELKKFDRTKKASVTQVSGGFNPLTAGSDKSEANRILGKQRTDDSGISFFQSSGFLVGMLALIMAILIFAMIPTSSKKLMNHARSLMASEEPADWINARDDLKEVMARGKDSPFFNEAEKLYFESRRRSLVLQAERGKKIALQSFASQNFLDAVQFQISGKAEQAIEAFQKLVDQVDENGSERHIHWEAASRLSILLSENKINRQEKLVSIIDSQRTAQSTEQLEDAIEKLNQLVNDIRNEPELQQVVELAQEVLVQCQTRLEEQRQKDDNSSEQDTNTSF